MGAIINIFSKSHIGAKASLLIAFFTFISQILAVLRDMLLARSVGIGNTLDIYFSAFRVPDILYVILSSFVAATVIVPLLFEEEKKSKESEINFIESIFRVTLIVAILSIFLVYLFLPYIANLLVLGFSGQDTNTYVSVTRILLLSPLILTISAFFGGINQKINSFLAFAVAPVVYNIGIIIGIVFLYPYFQIYGLVLGVVLGCLLHLGIQYIGAHKYGFKLWNFPKLRDLKIGKRVLIFALPRSGALFFAQLQMFILVGIISLAGTGAISSFFFAYNLQSVFLSLIGASISVAVFGTLTKAISLQDFEAYHNTLKRSIQTITFLSIPVTLITLILAKDIVQIMYGLKQENGLNNIVLLFSIAIVSITFQSLSLLLSRAHYAGRSIYIPLYSQIIPSLIFFIYLLTIKYHINLFESVLNGGTILFSVSAFIQFIILSTTLPHKAKGFWQGEEVLRYITAGFISYIIIYFVNSFILKTFISSSFFAIIARSIFIALIFTITYYLLLRLMKSKGLQIAETKVRSILFK